MMQRILSFIFAVLFFTAASSTANAQSATQRYAEKYRPLAVKLSAEFGIPATVILAVACIESSSGAAKNCQDLNNHFGIVGHNTLARKTRYKQYESAAASYYGFCQLMTRKRFYNGLRGNTEVAAWLNAISGAGYSEHPAEWIAKVSGVIKVNRL